MALVITVVVLLTVVFEFAYVTGIYNGLITVSNNINKAWANIDVLLKQRHDEIPKLVKVVEGYLSHERGVIDRVMKAREVMMGARGPAEKGRAEGEMERSLRQLF